MAKGENMHANTEERACFWKSLMLAVLFVVTLLAVYLTAGHCSVAHAASRGHQATATADVDWRLQSRFLWDGGDDLRTPRLGAELEKVVHGTNAGLWGGLELQGADYTAFIGPDLVYGTFKLGAALGYEAADGYALAYAVRARYEEKNFAMSAAGVNRYNGDLKDLTYQIFLEARALPNLSLILTATDPAAGGGVKVYIPGGVDFILTPAYNYEAGHPCLLAWLSFHAGSD